MKWHQRHCMGFSAFVSGLCFQAMIECLIKGNLWTALLEFILFALNAFMYVMVYLDRNERL